MKNLINEILKAKSKEEFWNDNTLKSIINDFLNFSNMNQIDWDDDSGEEWVDLICNNKLVAILHVKFPICFAKKDFKDFSLLNEKNFSTVFVEDFNEQEWCVNIDDLKKITSISWHASIEAVNPNLFSIFDFRFATV
ncbi:MAG: hypothetical protein Q8920_09420 [Bacillota bacterium]|nr:hypothetical protein [Bacillota bacterium]